MSTEQKVITKTEWTRSEPIDRTKRVAPGAEINTKNVQRGTRSRKNVNYSENALVALRPQRSNVRKNKDSHSKNVLEVRNQSTIAQLTNATKGLTIKAAPVSENNPARKKVSTPKKNQKKVEKTEEEEEQVEEQEEEQEEQDEEQKAYRDFAEGKDVESDNEDYEDAEEADDEDDQLNNSAMEEDPLEALEQEAKESNSLPLIRDSKRRYADDKLAPAVLKQLKRLGVKVPETVAPSTYREKASNLTLPAPLAYLSHSKADEKLFKSTKYELSQMEFIVCDLQEWNDFAFLKKFKDAVIIAEGEVLLVTRARPGEKVDLSDPQVWIVDEDSNEGPFALSEILATFEEDDDEPADE